MTPLNIAKENSKALIDASKKKATAIIEKAKTNEKDKFNRLAIISAAKAKAKEHIEATKKKAFRIIEKAKQKGGTLMDDYTGFHIGPEGAKVLAGKLLEFIKPINPLNKIFHREIGITKTIKLENNLDITEINLKNGDIGAKGMQALEEALKSLSLLKNLVLNGNQIGDIGATSLSRALPSMAKLEFLDLRNNQIGNEGAYSLSRALPSMAKLEYLELSDNNIDYDGATILVKAFHESGSGLYKTIYLTNNNITNIPQLILFGKQKNINVIIVPIRTIRPYTMRATSMHGMPMG